MGACHVRNQCLIIRMPREVDHFQAEIIRGECEIMFFKSCIRDVIFDFSDTAFMDSSGIGLILGRMQQVYPVEGQVYLFGGSPSIRKMWEMSGLSGRVVLLETAEEMREVYA
ncbi:MAG: anti-sigma factor antagonist [Eubacteriales bacterium]|nr:anti-sigma factor antagonist [Eubacteriales bacterium]